MFRVFCDFDGTITNRDTIVFLTERFGAGMKYRREILEAIKSGRMTVFEAIARELATVRLPWDEARRALERHVSIDPSFPNFIQWCQDRGFPVAVVSSGLRPVVELFVGHLEVPIYAHDVDCDTSGWRYRRNPLVEKTRILQEPGEGKRVYVGDGTSDVSVIPHVEVLFAKDFLAGHCLREDQPFLPFEDFEDVQRQLELHISDE